MPDNVLANVTPFQNWFNYSLVLTESPQKLRSTPEKTRAVYIRNPTGNTGTVYIGSEGLTTTNAPIALTAGQEVEIAIASIQKVYVLTSNAGDSIAYSWEV